MFGTAYLQTFLLVVSLVARITLGIPERLSDGIVDLQLENSVVGAEKQGGKVLVYAPIISRSIRIKIWPLLEAMVARGHQVVAVMPDFDGDGVNTTETIRDDLTLLLTEDPNQGLFKRLGSQSLDPQGAKGLRQTFHSITGTFGEMVRLNDAALGHPALTEVVEEGMDLFLVYTTAPHWPAYYLAERCGASLALYASAQGPGMQDSWAAGQPFNPAYAPVVGTAMKVEMSFLDRVENVVALCINAVLQHTILLPQFEEVLDRHFPNESRTDLMALEKSNSLVLHTGHPILDGVRPVSPSFQYIGPIHCREAKRLPSDLKQLLDSREGDEGVILVSFGSMYPSHTQMTETMKNVFQKLKQTVIWKLDADIEDLSDNVVVSKWLPQQDILGHKSTRLFITHGGQSSIQEALCHKIPVVVIPLAHDQNFYGNQAERLGFGKNIKYKKQKKTVKHKTKGFLFAKVSGYDRRLVDAAEMYGDLILDQITRPVDRAIWWLEFVMRHKGNNHFRSPVHDLNWYKYFLVDVIVFLAAILVITSLFLYIACRCLCWAIKHLLKAECENDKKSLKKDN